MWIHKITTMGRAEVVVLPAALRRQMGWRRGDFVQIDLIDAETITMRCVPDRKLTDNQIAAAKAEATTIHE